ncbi:MAG: hypothetical protein E7559_06225 [Ruminococcaceae bacterium]|nr:hypothetical protein [Oscillospiraceae bacterium]
MYRGKPPAIENRYEGDFAPFPIQVRVRKTGRTYEEESLIAVRTATDIVEACGSDCRRYIDLPEEGVAVVCPFKRGIVADFDLAATLLKYLLNKHRKVPKLLYMFRRPSVVLCFPRSVKLTTVETAAYNDCMMQAGCGKVRFFEGGIDELPRELEGKFDIAIGITYEEPRE